MIKAKACRSINCNESGFIAEYAANGLGLPLYPKNLQPITPENIILIISPLPPFTSLVQQCEIDTPSALESPVTYWGNSNKLDTFTKSAIIYSIKYA